MTNDAQELLDRIKAGERIEAEPSDAANELMKAGLIETHALVWETRVCYVPAGLDPRREAVVSVIRDKKRSGLTDEEFADRILATLS